MMPFPVSSRRGRAMRGFTLVELVVVIVILSLIGTTVALFVKPSVDAFIDVRSRADLADQGDTSLRRMLRDVRHAVPNSLRAPNTDCFELVPSVAGGRYRMGPDLPSGTGQFIDAGQAATSFDTLSELSTAPVNGDWVVINNQNNNDVYEGSNRWAVTGVSSLSGTPDRGYLNLSFASLQVPPGYNGGRFQIVRSNEESVFYVCSGVGVSGGKGTGTLYRVVRNFTPAYPAACPAVSGAAVLATHVSTCRFIYSPTQGATQQSGFIWMQLALTRNSETANLIVGAHVMNQP